MNCTMFITDQQNITNRVTIKIMCNKQLFYLSDRRIGNIKA